MKPLTVLVAGTVMLSIASCSTDGARDRASDDSSKSVHTVELHADGINEHAIGSDIDSVVDAIGGLLGTPMEEQKIRCESGADRIVRWARLYIVVDNDTFAGYRLFEHSFSSTTADAEDSNRQADRPVKFVTQEGLAIGDTVLTASKLYSDKFVIDESSLGPEWWVERDNSSDLKPLLRGSADGLSGEAAITSIGAGDLCVFR